MYNIFKSILILFLCLKLNAQETLSMKGEAFNSDNKLVYIEDHTFNKLPNGEITEIKTIYKNASGKIIAEVTSTFTKDLFIPDSIFTDYRFNQKQELTYDLATQMIHMKITEMKTGKSKSNTIKRQENMVSGQGFHNYILRHYNKKQADIKFIVLPKLDYYSFYFEKTTSNHDGNSRFVLKISNWILRTIVNEIVVEYKDKDRSLVLFEGLTNIDSDERNSQILKIKMSYPGESNDKKSF